MILEDTLLTRSEYIRHAANIAEKHRMGKYDVKSVPNAAKCADLIADTYARILSAGEAAAGGIHSIPSDEWIGDNFHLINEAAESADSEESRKLVKSIGKTSSSLGVYEIAAEIAAHTDGRIGETEIIDFVSHYEKVKPLTTNELACLCHMLKVALLKRLAEICEISDSIYKARKEAERIFREFLSYTGDMENGRRRSADVLFENEDLLSPVFAETILRISAEYEGSEQSSGTGSAVIRAALSKKLAAKGTTVEELIAREHSTRISMGISAGNAIKSLHGLNSLDWDKITSVLCVTEQILNRDPSGIFRKMTSKSRGEYVRLVRVCARRRGETPEAFALKIVEQAEKEDTHVGKYIYEEYTRKNEFRSFLFMLFFVTAVLAFCPAVYTIRLSAARYGWAGLPLILITVGLILLIGLNLALTIAQNMYLEKRMPFSLPELDFQGILPEDCKIMIVIPCLLNSKKRVDEIVKQLEAAAWANPQTGIFFTILGDLPESESKTRPEDEELIQYARRAVRNLKRSFPRREESEKFHVMVRERVYYEKDRTWMGAERKRGALIELNRAIIEGRLPRVNYVLTVDADTIIPIDTAIRMAQILHHPLNRPQISYVRSEPVVTKGYALLQPAVTPAGLDRQHATPFEKIYCDDEGYDSYQCKTSDFYFDICNEGIYTGKGMYDPYEFNGLLEGRFRENSILSHDLIEGSFLRTAFVSDVHLYDHFPRSYGSFVKRQHRWVRGDWQLLPFRRKRFEDGAGAMKNNPLNYYSLFKMDMNLIRSLLPAAIFLLFAIGMIFLRKYAFLWVLITALAVFFSAGGTGPRRLLRAFFEFLFLPHRAYYHCDAAVRAVWRTFVSRKKMLEWVVSSDAERSIGDTPSYYCKTMWFSFAAAVLFAPFLFGIPSLLWIAAPYAAYFLSVRAKGPDAVSVSGPARRSFRILARKIWAFYDDYAVENENYLPPDNVQFSPVYCVAHRTSPTNIGFLIVSVLIAERLGYLSSGEMTERLSAILDTIDRMERWNGHIYNWYDTITLQPLEPRYVSSVDSGNLAAALLTAASLLRSRTENAHEENPRRRAAEGLLDTIYCLNEIALPEHRVEAALLEDYLAKDENEGELLRIVKYYQENLHIIPEEKADAHSFRCKLLKMTQRLWESLNGAEEYCGFESKARELADRLTRAALRMDFKVLYSKQCRHLHIGYNQTTGEFSPSYYDMLMSEARLTSYVAMGKGDIGAEHFTALARRWNDDNTLLLSWSGTVFEYILPELFLASPHGSLLQGSVQNMLKTEISQAQGKPWGVSESGYNVLDVNMNYKYKAFGLKALAVKRMRENDSVVAPYASLMACAQIPDAVLLNMEALTKAGAAGKYGFYEAIDYTPGRRGVVESFMAHHLGMSLCAAANLLFDGMLTEAFGKMPMMAAVNVMLTGKMPRRRCAPRKPAASERRALKTVRLPSRAPEKEEEPPVCISGRDAEVLSNGKYSVVLNGLGGGYSTLGEIGITVRRENKAPDGIVFYLNGKLLVPVKCELSSGKAEYTYFTNEADVQQSICVASDENAELRLVRISNKEKEARSVNLTLYCELMLAKPRAYADHPSYTGMFVTTEAQTDRENRTVFLSAKRRRHQPSEPPLMAYCAMSVSDKYKEAVESEMYDTDVLTFQGRNCGIAGPAVFRSRGSHSDVLLAENSGIVLNPCFAVNTKIRVEAGSTVEICYILGAEENGGALTEKLERLKNTERVFELARTRSLIEREHISLREGDLQYFRSFSSKLLYGKKHYSQQLQRKLWGFGISGDYPIVTVMLRHIENASHLEKLVRLWCFYSFRGIKIDLALAVFDHADYISPIHELADSLSLKAMWGCFPVRGDIYVVVPKNGESAKPLIEASNIVFWL
ncbi:MAG: hypothetical protein KHX22_03705 [Clostridiales bacterium]|nr:hypothetical protein [Clostridiales bacterium]